MNLRKIKMVHLDQCDASNQTSHCFNKNITMFFPLSTKLFHRIVFLLPKYHKQIKTVLHYRHIDNQDET